MEDLFLYTKKILLVDDEPELRRLVTDILLDDGFMNIIEADTVQTGLNSARQGKPDLAILDVMLPDGDGFTLMKELRIFTNIPIIFLTAKSFWYIRINLSFAHSFQKIFNSNSVIIA